MATDHPTAAALEDEARKARKVRHIVDISAALIRQGNLTRREAEGVVAIARAEILKLFPDGEQTFELIYTPRFTRLIDEFAVPEPEPGTVVLPFRRSRI